MTHSPALLWTRTEVYVAAGRPPSDRGTRVVLIDVVAEAAHDLMRYYEVEPADHPGVAAELQELIASELLDLGAEVLRRHGLRAAP